MRNLVVGALFVFAAVGIEAGDEVGFAEASVSHPITAAKEGSMFLGLRTVVYQVDDLDMAKKWYSEALGFGPYFDESFYVGFNVGGYELGLHPTDETAATGKGGATAYWGVEDVNAAMARLLDLGASVHGEVQDVGEGILVASVVDPFGNLFGIIQNPHFKLE